MCLARLWAVSAPAGMWTGGARRLYYSFTQHNQSYGLFTFPLFSARPNRRGGVKGTLSNSSKTQVTCALCQKTFFLAL